MSTPYLLTEHCSHNSRERWAGSIEKDFRDMETEGYMIFYMSHHIFLLISTKIENTKNNSGLVVTHVGRFGTQE